MKQKLHLYLFVLVFSYNCAGSDPQLETKKQNVDYLIEQGKVLWSQRTNNLSLDKAGHFIGLAHKQRPDDFELSVLMGQINYHKAYFIETETSKKDSLFLEGSNICKKAVMVHPDFNKVYNKAMGDSTFKLLSAIADAPKSVVPGLYWWAVNLAYYLINKPVLARLNQRELMETIMHRVLALEPAFHFSGPYRFFGILYTRIPGIELSQSETYFNQALTADPEYLGNKVTMAEFYHQKAGNREQFNLFLKEILDTDLVEHPELLIENYFFQKRAETLLERESSLFE